jgi:cytoskeletal protein RodZ
MKQMQRKKGNYMRKKNNVLRIILIVIGVLFAIGIIGNLFNKAKPSTPNTPAGDVTKGLENSSITNPTEAAFVPTETPAAPTEAPKLTSFKAGTYKVGTDIPAGEYVVFCDNNLLGYFELSSDSTGSLESIIANENFSYNSIITIKDGEYFKMQGSYAVPMKEAGTLNTTGSGMFKIGTHLPAGEYKLESTGDTMGYYEVATDSSHNLNSIKTNENFEGNTYVTVTDGQYLKISSAKIVK